MRAVRSARHFKRRNPLRPVSSLSLAIATALFAMPALASQPSPSNGGQQTLDAVFRAADQAAMRGSVVAPLSTGGGAVAGDARPQAESDGTGEGSYLLASGERSDDLEAAAASWREDPEFQGDWGLQAIGAEYAYARGITGEGVQLGLLDSGVFDPHGEFAGDGKLTLLDTRDAIGLPENELPGEFGAFDGRPLIGFTGYSDHGTHVAGTIAANRDGRGMHGVAYGASLNSATHFLGLDAFVVMRGGQIDPVAASVDALVDSGARFVNHSWGISNDALLHDAPLQDALDTFAPRLHDEGIEAFRHAADAGQVQVFAAGNVATEAALGTGPHASAWGSAPLLFPELESNWLVVTNMMADGSSSESSYLCGHSKYWCVTAPGTDIVSSTIERSLSGVYEQIRLDAANSDEPFTREELLNEVIELQDYVGNLDFYIDLLVAADEDSATAVVENIMSRAARISGLLSRYDMSGESENNQIALAGYRDDPSIFLERANALVGDLMRQVPLEAFIAIAFQSQVNAEFGAMTHSASYGGMSGTSMAAPHVTGALGLVAERFAYMDNVQVRDTLLTTAGDGAEIDDRVGWGLIDLAQAMNGPGAFLRDFDVELPAGVEDTWSNDITNALVRTGRDEDRGALVKRGAGSLTLSGDNSFDGFSVLEGLLTLSGVNAYGEGFDGYVSGGALSLTGTLQGNALRVGGGVAEVGAGGVLDGADLFVGGAGGRAVAYVDGVQTGGSTLVGEGGRLGGNGRLGDTTIAAGGSIAPGRSIGTLTVDGDYVQQAGSSFEVEMTPPDQVDRLEVTGTATLEGGTVVAQRGPGVYALGERYDFLSAEGGISGAFDALDTTAITPFLGLSLTYLANGVSLDVSRGASFASVGGSYNQQVTGAGLDGLADASPLVGSLVQLFPEDAVGAFDLLSGDVHATVQSVLVDSSRHARGSALARARGDSDPLQAQADADRAFGAWVDIQRNGGRLDGDGNAAGTEYSGGNTLVGADYRFDNGLRLGVMGGIGETDMKAAERLHARTDLDTRQAGVYAGYSWRGLGLRGGWTYAQHDVDVERAVRYPGFDGSAHADYDASSRQLFVEAGYRFGNERWGVEPYAQFAQVRVSSDAFSEDGGAAALSGRTRDVRADITTGGLRFDVNLRAAQQSESWLGLRGGIGYRKTGGELVPWTDVAFAGGDSFVVHGAPVGSDATLLELGLAARTSANSLLEVGYSGQYADEARDHGGNLRWSLRF